MSQKHGGREGGGRDGKPRTKVPPDHPPFEGLFLNCFCQKTDEGSLDGWPKEIMEVGVLGYKLVTCVRACVCVQMLP